MFNLKPHNLKKRLSRIMKQCIDKVSDEKNLEVFELVVTT